MCSYCGWANCSCGWVSCSCGLTSCSSNCCARGRCCGWGRSSTSRRGCRHRVRHCAKAVPQQALPAPGLSLRGLLLLRFSWFCSFLFFWFRFLLQKYNHSVREIPKASPIFPRQPTEQPGVTMSEGVSSTRRPSLSSALSIIPWLSTPFSFLGGKLAMKQTCLPTNACGSG